MLSEKSLAQTGLFDASRAKMLVNKLRKSSNPGEIDSMALTGILSTQIVCDNYINRPSAPLPQAFKVDLLIDRRS